MSRSGYNFAGATTISEDVMTALVNSREVEPGTVRFGGDEVYARRFKSLIGSAERYVYRGTKTWKGGVPGILWVLVSRRVAARFIANLPGEHLRQPKQQETAMRNNEPKYVLVIDGSASMMRAAPLGDKRTGKGPLRRALESWPHLDQDRTEILLANHGLIRVVGARVNKLERLSIPSISRLQFDGGTDFSMAAQYLDGLTVRPKVTLLTDTDADEAVRWGASESWEVVNVLEPEARIPEPNREDYEAGDLIVVFHDKTDCPYAAWPERYGLGGWLRTRVDGHQSPTLRSSWGELCETAKPGTLHIVTEFEALDYLAGNDGKS